MTEALTSSVADPNRGRRVAERYAELIQNGDVEGVVGLYAEDATVAHANPNVRPPSVTGRPALREFYAHISSRHPNMTNFVFHSSAEACVFEFHGVMEGERHLEMVDVFLLNDRGEVTRMDAYTRIRAGVRGGTI